MPDPDIVAPAQAGEASGATTSASPSLALPSLRASLAERLTATLAVVAALWWGQRFLVPLAAGLMLAVLVSPLVVRLQRVLRSTGLAAVVALALVMAALAAAAMAFGAQLVRVAERTPQLISLVAQQLAAREPNADSLLQRARVALHELDAAADRLVIETPQRHAERQGNAAAAAPAASAAAPNQHITESATMALRGSAVSGSSVLLSFAGTLSIIFFIAFFVLAGGKPLADLFLGLWSYRQDAHENAQRAWQECARQLRIYAGVLVVTNTVIGALVWLAFMLSGLPDAAGWGVTAAVLHVVPYLGMTLLTALGAAETFLVHGTLGAALGMALLLVLLSTLIGTFVSAWLQGRAANMNPAALFIGLLFWGSLWGIWGLFLGPVLVVVFKVLAENSRTGKHLASLMRG
jgi:predicted PurR-regulated permease PerM